MTIPERTDQQRAAQRWVEEIFEAAEFYDFDGEALERIAAVLLSRKPGDALLTGTEVEGKPSTTPDHSRTPDTADEIVSESLRIVQVHLDNTFEGARLIDGDMRMHLFSISTVVNTFGLAVAMETLRRVAPEVAERCAKTLWAIWDDGGVIGEHVWPWRKQIAAGQEIDRFDEGRSYVFDGIVGDFNADQGALDVATS